VIENPVFLHAMSLKPVPLHKIKICKSRVEGKYPKNHQVWIALRGEEFVIVPARSDYFLARDRKTRNIFIIELHTGGCFTLNKGDVEVVHE